MVAGHVLAALPAERAHEPVAIGEVILAIVENARDTSSSSVAWSPKPDWSNSPTMIAP
jgi:hypothetical protein